MPTSVVPPAGQGTIRVTGRAGKSCARPAPAHPANAKVPKVNAAASVAKALHFMVFPSRHRPIFCARPDDEAAGYVRSFFAAIGGLCAPADSIRAGAMSVTPETVTARPSVAD